MSPRNQLVHLREWLLNHRQCHTRHFGESDQSGHPHGYAGIVIPEWDVRQRLDDIQASLDGSHEPRAVVMTELDALLDRVREDKADSTGKNRNVVAYDCWRMFEDLAKRYKEEFASRDRYKRQSKAWMDKALSLAQEARCPVCVNGQTLAGEVCQECHGKDTASVAYDTLRMHYKRVAEACNLAFKLPRPWMDGAISYEEWDAAFTAIETALAWKLPELFRPNEAPYDWEGQSEL